MRPENLINIWHGRTKNFCLHSHHAKFPYLIYEVNYKYPTDLVSIAHGEQFIFLVYCDSQPIYTLFLSGFVHPFSEIQT